MWEDLELVSVVVVPRHYTVFQPTPAFGVTGWMNGVSEFGRVTSA